MTIKFKVGNYYKHTGGGMMHIVGGAKTTMWGWCLIAEEAGSSQLQPVGQDSCSAENWTLSTETEWMKNFS